jgi:hypothetical protein
MQSATTHRNLRKGQIWQVNNQFVLVDDVGKTLVHYRMLKRLDRKAVAVQVSPGRSKPASCGQNRSGHSICVSCNPHVESLFSNKSLRARSGICLRRDSQLMKTKWLDRFCPSVAGSRCPLTVQVASAQALLGFLERFNGRLVRSSRAEENRSMPFRWSANRLSMIPTGAAQ